MLKVSEKLLILRSHVQGVNGIGALIHSKRLLIWPSAWRLFKGNVRGHFSGTVGRCPGLTRSQSCIVTDIFLSGRGSKILKKLKCPQVLILNDTFKSLYHRFLSSRYFCSHDDVDATDDDDSSPRAQTRRKVGDHPPPHTSSASVSSSSASASASAGHLHQGELSPQLLIAAASASANVAAMSAASASAASGTFPGAQGGDAYMAADGVSHAPQYPDIPVVGTT